MELISGDMMKRHEGHRPKQGSILPDPDGDILRRHFIATEEGIQSISFARRCLCRPVHGRLSAIRRKDVPVAIDLDGTGYVRLQRNLGDELGGPHGIVVDIAKEFEPVRVPAPTDPRTADMMLLVVICKTI
jgi:hypothetical protein